MHCDRGLRLSKELMLFSCLLQPFETLKISEGSKPFPVDQVSELNWACEGSIGP